MKKFLLLCTVFAVLLGSTLTASAATTLDFGTDISDWGTVLTNEYEDLGFTFSGDNRITSGDDSDPDPKIGTFNQWFPSDGNILQYRNGKNAVNFLTISLDFTSDYLGFIYRRPGAAGSFEMELYNNGAKVAWVLLNWDPADGWASFAIGDIDFDEIVLSSTNKFVLDNLTVNAAVPVPASMMLLAMGLLPVVATRRKK